MCNKARFGLGLFKAGARNTKNEKHMCPYQLPNNAERNKKAWEPTIHEQRAGTLGNLGRRTMKGSGWETFNLAGGNQLI